MKRARKKQPRIIDVEPVEVETTAMVVAPRVRTAKPRPVPQARYVPAPGEIVYPAGPVLDPTGRIDIAAYRAAVEYALPWAEAVLGVPGLGRVLAPWAECMIAEYVPGVNIFAPPKPRRRLR